MSRALRRLVLLLEAAWTWTKCRLGRHQLVFLGRTQDDPRPRQSCVACGGLWVRVRHDMDIYWDRIPEEGQ